MGLTKPRAAQIYNLDYKQSTRVISTSNVTLVGGAPNSVDGVNLVVNDRILVIGQSPASQNGIYKVSIVGTGSDGTWVRTSDTNETGEVEAGMIVMVTEGLVYADTQWKLITDDPITIGSTALTFEQNYYANSINAGNSNVVVNSNGNVTVSSAGIANVLVVSSTGAFVSGTVSSSGNVNGGNLTTAGQVTAAGNITGGNILSSGTVSASSSVIGANIETTGQVTATGNVTGGNITTAGALTATGNVTGGNITTAGVVTTTGNVTGGNINTIGVVTATGNISGGNINTAGAITATGNISGGNINTAGAITATGNITGNYFFGNGSQLTGIVAGSVDANSLTGNTLSSNVLFSSLTSVGTLTSLSVSGNVTANYFFGNGSQLTGISATAAFPLESGNSNIAAPVANGNISITVGGVANVVVVSTTGIDITGSVSATGNISGGNLVTNGNASAGNLLATSGISAGGNIQGSNLFISATGNVSAGNVVASSQITATGNVTGGNILTAGQVSAAGNVTGNNFVGNILYLSTTSNISTGSTGQISWNTPEATFDMYLENGVTLQVGQENNFWVVAQGNIADGSVVSFVGASNNAIIASEANAAAPGFSADLVLGVATQFIEDGTLGYVTTFGKVRNINTNAFNVGDILYLDPTTPGGFTNTVPSAPNPKVEVAAVLQKGIANGAVVVRTTAFPRLENLQDVDGANAVNKDYLRYTTSGNLWQHTALDISDDTSPTLGGNLEGAGFNIANVSNIGGGNIILTGAGFSNATVTLPNQLATKAYVDTATSTGLHIHEPVLVEASFNLNATYANGGTTQTVDSITNNKTLTFTTSPALAVNDVIVFDNSFNGINGNTAYFVFSTNGGNQVTLSDNYQGLEITNLTNGSSLAQPSRANSGVGATLTNAGANAALNISNVAMSVNDRVLVYQQNNTYENGVYVVSNVGNATTQWVLTRSSDADSYAPQDTMSLGGGDYFFITSGDAAGESYVCSNESVIIFGITPITFTLFSATPTYTGTSPVVVTGQVISLANLTGVGDTVVLQDSPTLITPNIGAATGNSLSVLGNITGANANITGSISAVGNIAGGNVLTAGNVSATGYQGTTISVSGTVDTGNINGAGYVSAVANVIGGNILTGGLICATGNILGANLLISSTGNVSAGNLLASSNISAGGNIQGSNLLISSTGNVSAGNILASGQISATGNITGNNVSVSTLTNGRIPYYDTNRFIDSNQLLVGSTPTPGQLAITIGNPVGGSGGLFVTNGTSTQIILDGPNSAVSASGNIIGGNLTTAGQITATGNVTGNYFFGNGSQLTGIITTVSNINNGTSNVSIDSANANITMAVNGTANVVVVSSGGINTTGFVSATGNINSGNINTAGLITATGNINGGNINTAGLITATGNINGGNINSSDLISATGNINAGNLLTTGLISATSTITSAANIVGANIITVGLVTATGNVTGGNIITSGIVTATGNITANYYFGNGSQLTGISAAATFPLASGTSNIAAPVADGNIAVTVGGVANVAVFAATGAFITGVVSATGNITGGNLILSGNVIDTGELVLTSSANNGNVRLLPGPAGSIIIGGAIINSQGNGVGNIGNSTGYFNTVFAKATSAQYADLAEMYLADATYTPGTVVEFGGVNEVTISVQSHSTRVAGIVSTNPSYLMNATQSGDHAVAVALVGRVPCRVVGTINKGDRLVSSHISGVAQKLNIDNYEPGCIIGKALENYDSQQVGIIEVAVGRF